jgi:zinc transport system substrate-binding protein
MQPTVCVAFVCALLACVGLGSEPQKKPLLVVSFPPLYSFTANIVGGLATVETLISGGVSPHDFQFSPRDIRRVQDADLLVLHGLGFEPWRKRLNTSARVVEAASGLQSQLLRSDEHAGHNHHDAVNPHTWLDPQLAILSVSNILTAITNLDSANAARYQSNAAAYIERLRALDSELAAALKPFAGAAVMTYHDLLPYFARRYELKIAAVVQPVAEVNPSPRRIAELRRIVREQKVVALLVEPNARSPLAERLGDEFGIPLVEFESLETGPSSPLAYELAMRRNVAALKRVLR